MKTVATFAAVAATALSITVMGVVTLAGVWHVGRLAALALGGP
jgi:hypothetical protein